MNACRLKAVAWVALFVLCAAVSLAFIFDGGETVTITIDMETRTLKNVEYRGHRPEVGVRLVETLPFQDTWVVVIAKSPAWQ